MAAPGPADPDNGNIFCQFDVQGKRELVAGSAPVVGRFFCLLPPCHQELYIATSRLALASHRELVHGLPDKGSTKLPKLRDTTYWLLIGKPRPYEVPGKSERRSRTGKAASLRQSLVPGGEAGMAKLQPASLGGNIFEQFDVQHKEGFPNPIYICLLAPCFENEACFESHASWETHRSIEHMESNDDRDKLPAEWEVRDWVAKNKPRPSDVLVKPEPMKELKPSLIDPGVFAELDIRVTDEGKKRYFCLLDPCSRSGKSYQFHRCWTNHREQVHNHSSSEDGVFILPTVGILQAWVENGKPVPFRIPPQLLPISVQVYSGARPSTESRHMLEERRLDSPESTDTNVFFEIDFNKDVYGNGRFFCLLPTCVDSGVSFERQKELGYHRIKVHTDLPQLEPLPPRYVMDRWLFLGKPRPYTPRRRSTRRTRDATGGSKEREPAHQKKFCSNGCSVAASADDRNHAASGGDPDDLFWKDFYEKNTFPDDLLKSYSDDDTAAPEYSDPDYNDRAQDVIDDYIVDQTSEDPAHQYCTSSA